MTANKFSIVKWRPWRSLGRRFGAKISIFALTTIFIFLGAFESINLTLMDARFKFLDRDPSNAIVIVEIDPESLRREAHWPWSRERYARVTANLQEAGAQLIGYDVDFSSLRDSAGDAAFVDAMARRPGDTILPVFAQWSTFSRENRKVMETPPNVMFLQDAVLASVNLETEKNGIVRRGWWGFSNDEGYRPSMATALAAYPGAPPGTYYIDYSINPDEIPRLSFIDVLEGNFPRELVEGKTIIVGATALELGDEFAAPVYGLTHGVVLHALGYESIVQNRALKRSHSGLEILFACFVIFMVCGFAANQKPILLFVVYADIAIAAFVIPLLVQFAAPVSIDAGAVYAALFLSILYNHARAIQRKALELLEQRGISAKYQALTTLVVRDSFDGMMVVGEGGRIELINERAADYLGVDGEKCTARYVKELVSGFPLHPANRVNCDLENGAHPTHQHQSEFSTQDGKRVLEVISSGFVYERRRQAREDKSTPPYVFTYTLRDVTAKKQAELDEKRAKDALIAADEMKSQLLSNIRHELRTPLNGVIGFADVLQQEMFGPLGSDEYKEYAAYIHEGGTRLLNLVNDIVSVSHLQANDKEILPEFNSLHEVLEKVLEKFSKELEKENKILNVHCDKEMPFLKFDFSVFEEMLRHLISNAVKFTSFDGEITISGTYDKRGLVIEVKDDGCGVDPGLLPKVTEAFFQADGAINRSHEGAGLGLYIVDGLATLHGGRLQLENCTSGFIARLVFPAMEAEQQHAAA